MEPWNVRRILKQICDPERRQAILTSFWTAGDPHQQHRALAQLSSMLHFRPDTLRKSPPKRKAELLASRLSSAEFEEIFEIALMTYHTREKRDLLAAFLEQWNIPHQDGSIEVDDYVPPTEQSAQEAVAALRGRFELRDILVYFASAGLLMGNIPQWREATWPVVDRLLPELESSAA
jgi:hypothetical protein